MTCHTIFWYLFNNRFLVVASLACLFIICHLHHLILPTSACTEEFRSSSMDRLHDVTTISTLSALYNVTGVRRMIMCQSACLAETACFYAAFNQNLAICSLFARGQNSFNLIGWQVLIMRQKNVQVTIIIRLFLLRIHCNVMFTSTRQPVFVKENEIIAFSRVRVINEKVLISIYKQYDTTSAFYFSWCCFVTVHRPVVLPLWQ